MGDGPASPSGLSAHVFPLPQHAREQPSSSAINMANQKRKRSGSDSTDEPGRVVEHPPAHRRRVEVQSPYPRDEAVADVVMTFALEVAASLVAGRTERAAQRAFELRGKSRSPVSGTAASGDEAVADHRRPIVLDLPTLDLIEARQDEPAAASIQRSHAVSSAPSSNTNQQLSDGRPSHHAQAQTHQDRPSPDALTQGQQLDSSPQASIPSNTLDDANDDVASTQVNGESDRLAGNRNLRNEPIEEPLDGQAEEPGRSAPPSTQPQQPPSHSSQTTTAPSLAAQLSRSITPSPSITALVASVIQTPHSTTYPRTTPRPLLSPITSPPQPTPTPQPTRHSPAHSLPHRPRSRGSLSSTPNSASARQLPSPLRNAHHPSDHQGPAPGHPSHPHQLQLARVSPGLGNHTHQQQHHIQHQHQHQALPNPPFERHPFAPPPRSPPPQPTRPAPHPPAPTWSRAVPLRPAPRRRVRFHPVVQVSATPPPRSPGERRDGGQDARGEEGGEG